MLSEYRFLGEEKIITFDDTKSVDELVKYAFGQFGYYEPAGIEIVTLFQCHHPKTNTGWFTVDKSKKCADEIINRDELCFAYYLPNCFYFAEGGWGHHMAELGHHPDIPCPVALRFRFDDFDHTVVINGNYSLHDVFFYLKNTGYISQGCNTIKVLPIGTRYNYLIPSDDRIFDVKLFEVEKMLREYTDRKFPNHEFVYYEILELCYGYAD